MFESSHPLNCDLELKMLLKAFNKNQLIQLIISKEDDGERLVREGAYKKEDNRTGGNTRYTIYIQRRKKLRMQEEWKQTIEG